MITQKLTSPVDVNNSFTFSRPSVGFTSDGLEVNPHNARYEPGPAGFGNAVKIEEGTTNILNAPTFFTGMTSGVPTGWSKGSWTGATFTQFSNFVRIDASAATGINDLYAYSGTGVVTNGTTYTLSVVAKGSGTMNLYVYGNTPTQNTAFTLTSTPTRYSITVAASSTQLQLVITTNMGAVVDLYSAQIEQKAYSTSHTVSTRADELMTIPLNSNNYTPNSFTLEIWVYPTQSQWATGDGYLTSINNGTSSNRWDLKFNSGNYRVSWEFYDGTTVYAFSSTNGLTLNSWNYVAWGYDRTTNTQFVNVNGTKTAPGTPQSIPTFGAFTQMMLGTDYSTLISSRTNVLISGLRLSNTARSDADIATSSAGTSPLKSDANTTLLLPFNGPDAVRGAKSLNLGAI
jgi:hypothetical protein